MKPDVVVIGGGHNGLVAAAFLAKGGIKPLLLEARTVLGGAAVTEEFHPGFKVSSLAHTAELRPSVVQGLDLLGGGLKLLEPEPRFFAPTADGRGLSLFGDPERSAAEIGKLSAKDAGRYPEFHRSLSHVCELVSKVLDSTPPGVDSTGIGELFSLARLGLGFRGLGRTDAQRLLRWGPMAVADFAQEWFQTDLLRALVAARGIFGSFAGPWSAGTTANLLLQAASYGGNGAGSARSALGGVGAITQALAAAARKHGATLRTDAPVARILAKDGRISGVALSSGEEIEARAVVSGVDPQRTFLQLLDPLLLDPADFGRIRNYRQTGMASKVNFALSGLPAFAADSTALQGRIHIGPEIDYLERAFDEAKYGGIASRPYLDITIPSLSDPGLAPAGSHVLSVYVQYTPYRLRTGDWDARRQELGDIVVRTIEPYAPGFGKLIQARQVLTPLDLERTYGLTGGHPFHGEPALDQLYLARPLLGFHRYRAPVPGLYLCGAGSHPGGGVTGAPGANAAREILRDLG